MKKNKYIIFSIAALLISMISNTYAQQGPYIGIKGAAMNTWLLNDDDSDDHTLEYRATIRPTFGVELGYNLTNHLGLGIEAMYSMNGQKYERTGIEFTQRVNYLKVPVLLSFNSNPDNFVIFRGKIGPQLSFLTGADVVNADGETLLDDTKEFYTNMIIGGLLGLGFDFRLSDKLLLTTGLRIDFGFTNAENEDHLFYDQARATTYNTSGGLEIGVRYMLK